MDLTPLLTGIIGGVPAIVAAGFAYRSSAAANRVEHRKVDAEAYERAREEYEKLLDRLQQQIDRMQSNIDRLYAQLASEQDISNTLRNQLRTLMAQVAELEAMIAMNRKKTL